MATGLVICCIIILFSVCISLVIFAPKKNVFYNITNHYPDILSHFIEAQIELINKEIDEGDWKIMNEICLNDNSSYKEIELYNNKKYNVDIQKYNHTTNIISQIHGLQKAYLAELGPKSILKVQKNEPGVMRISIPLQKGFYKANYCGIWVKRETRCLYDMIMYDPSNIYSLYNKSRYCIKMIILDIFIEKPV